MTLIYRGAQVNCGLNINIAIGGKVYTPQNNPYTLFEVPLGNQTYTITGSINCGAAGWCNIVSGQGVITVQENSTFYLYWQSTAYYNQCQMSLNAQ